jgi:hypothetical protein
MNHRRYLITVAALGCLASTARAQRAFEQAPAPTDSVAAIHVSHASVMDHPSDAVRRAESPAPAPVPASGQHLGESKAEMAVGGAAIVVGAIIGGDGGRALMFGGAIVGLYGLYNYLK